MFRVHCPRHGQDVLLGQRQIVGIDGSGSELTVRWVCYCGHHGAHHPQQRHEALVAA
jgi:hypothetical protein